MKRKEYTPLLKIGSLVTCLSLLWSSLGWAFNPSLSFQSALAIEHYLDIPATTGHIIGHHKESKKTIICIEDLHCHYEVQKNIAKIIEHLYLKRAIKLIGVEGSSQPIDVGVLKDYPLENVRTAVADYFLKQGTITGAEFYAAVSSQPIRLQGVENKILYDQSLEKARHFLNTESQGILYDLHEVLAKLKPAIYSEKLAAYDQAIQAFYQRKTKFLDFVFYLEQLESMLDINMDLTGLLSQYWKARESIDYYPVNPQIEHDLIRLDQRIRDKLYSAPNQRKLDQFIHYLAILERLLGVSATTQDLKDYKYYRNFINNNDLIKFVSVYGEREVSSLTSDLITLSDYSQQALEFYQLADQRSTTFVQNLLEKMDDQNEQTAILISGGFHTDKIIETMIKRQISYVIIKPSLTQFDRDNPYFELLGKHKTDLGQLLSRQAQLIGLPSAWAQPAHRRLVLLLNKVLGSEFKHITPQLGQQLARYWDSYRSIDLVMLTPQEAKDKGLAADQVNSFEIQVAGAELVVLVMPHHHFPDSLAEADGFGYTIEINGHTVMLFQSQQAAVRAVQNITTRRIWEPGTIKNTLAASKYLISPVNESASGQPSASGRPLSPELLIGQCQQNVYCQALASDDIAVIKKRLSALASLEIMTAPDQRQTLFDFLVDQAYKQFADQAGINGQDKYSILDYCEIVIRGSFLFAPRPSDLDITILYNDSTMPAKYLNLPNYRIVAPEQAWEHLGQIERLKMDVMAIGRESQLWTDQLQNRKITLTGVHLWKQNWLKDKIESKDRLLLMEWSLALAKMLYYRGDYRIAFQRLLEGYAFLDHVGENTLIQDRATALYELLRKNIFTGTQLILREQIALFEGVVLREVEKEFLHHDQVYGQFYAEIVDEIAGLLVAISHDLNLKYYPEMIFHLCEFYGAAGHISESAQLDPARFDGAKNYFDYAARLYRRFFPDGHYQQAKEELALKEIEALAEERDKAISVYGHLLEISQASNRGKMVVGQQKGNWFRLPVGFSVLATYNPADYGGGVLPWLKAGFVNFKMNRYLKRYHEKGRLNLIRLKASWARQYAANAWWIEGLGLTILGSFIAAFLAMINPHTSLAAMSIVGVQSAWLLFPLAHLLPAAGQQELTADEKKNVNWATLLAVLNLSLSMTPIPLMAMIGFGFLSHWFLNLLVRIDKDRRISPKNLITLEEVFKQGNLNHRLAYQYVFKPPAEALTRRYQQGLNSGLRRIHCRLGWFFALNIESINRRQNEFSSSEFQTVEQVAVITLPWYLERLLIVTPEKKIIHKFIFNLMATYISKRIEDRLFDSETVQFIKQLAMPLAAPLDSKSSVLVNNPQVEIEFEEQIGIYLTKVPRLKEYLSSSQVIRQAFRQWRQTGEHKNQQIFIDQLVVMLEKLEIERRQNLILPSEFEGALEAVNGLFVKSTLFRKNILAFFQNKPIWMPKEAKLGSTLRYLTLWQSHRASVYLVNNLFEKLYRPDCILRAINGDA